MPKHGPATGGQPPLHQPLARLSPKPDPPPPSGRTEGPAPPPLVKTALTRGRVEAPGQAGVRLSPHLHHRRKERLYMGWQGCRQG